MSSLFSCVVPATRSVSTNPSPCYSRRITYPHALGWSLILLLLIEPFAEAEEASQETAYEEIIVTGSSPLANNADERNVPYQVQVFDESDLENGHYTSIASLLGRRASGVSVSHAQNNPLQPDVQVRGFSASPLLGAPQGVAVYLNGARINEPFGDTVNWDLIRGPFIGKLSLLSGTNAAYGLNALGGTLLIKTRTGFDSDRNHIALSTGSFGREELSLSSGDNNGRWGYFVGLDSFEEEGWRDHSPSTAHNAYAALGMRGEEIEWDLYGFAGDTNLHGNGAAPEQLLALDREAVFTHPDITENQMFMLHSELRMQLSTLSSLRLSAFGRDTTTDSFNGDGSEFEECEPPLSGFLCDEDDGEPIEDQQGNMAVESFDAINNISRREQLSWGATAEYYRQWQLAKQPHYSSVGLDFYRGTTVFRSAVELAQLQGDRSTSRSGRFIDEGATALDAYVQSVAVYWLDRFSPAERMEMTLSLRYNESQLTTDDESRAHPELTSEHEFTRLNGGIGLIFSATRSLDFYANLDQSSRTPTPVELACSHPEAPCTLPNTFLADPPLDEVVARTVEAGFRSPSGPQTQWSVATFLSSIDDDIVFQATGGVSSNEGFFSNASDTRRVGVLAQVEAGGDTLRWSVQYTWLEATFEDDFFVSSPNHPAAVDGHIAVSDGDSLPGIPQQSVNVGIDWQLTDRLNWQWDLHYRSGVYLRGDEGNLDNKTGSSRLVNTVLSYRPSQNLKTYIVIDNIFNEEFESFGLYGDPDEVLPYLEFENNRFLSPNEPRGIRLGIRYSW